VDSGGPRWSGDVHQADWIAPRLAPWDGEYTVALVVPAGFEAYARVLHPAESPDNGERLVRWAEVAAWSGLPLRNDAQFHSIALPPHEPGGAPPFGGQGPRQGSLYVPDAEALAAIARHWTRTPQDCWFCVWDGFGWPGFTMSASMTESGAPTEFVEQPRRDPVPGPVRDGPRVRLPHRDYLLYRGTAAAVSEVAGLDGTWDQCPNLWWPADRAWCVASDIDLQWSYVGGPRGLIDAILADDRIEALPAAPDDPLTRVEDWVSAWVAELADALLADGEGALRTPRGSIEARLQAPGRTGDGELSIESTGTRHGYTSSSWHTLHDAGEPRDEVTSYLTFAVLDLAGM
jgi:hypothetical protein